MLASADPVTSPAPRSKTDLLAGVSRLRLALATGVEIALLDWGGPGPLALLHHANGFCAGVWGVVAEGLRSRFRVVAMDARGHGDSSKPKGREAYRWGRFADDLVAVADALSPEAPGRRVALGMGHSFGGTATILAAARRPDLFERLVLVDPVVPIPDRAAPTPERSAHVSRLANAARDRQRVRASRAEARAVWTERRFFADWDPRVLDLYAAEGLRDLPDGRVELKCPAEVEASIFEQGGSIDLLAQARHVRAPALVLTATQGDFPRAMHEGLVRALPHGRLEDVDAGHLVPMERPDLVASAALRFGGEP